jgi:hypothetical protein
MQPTQTLPSDYTLRWSFNMKRDVKVAVIMQAAGLVLLFAFGWLFVAIAAQIWNLRKAPTYSFDLQQNSGQLIAVLLGGFVFIILLHELIHGIFFQIFSRALPKYGIGWGYAYAAAPDWYFPRNQYLVIGLAPLIGISVIGVALMFVAPSAWIWALVYMLTINASGAVGDIWIVARIARENADVYVRDLGDGFEVYGNP